jgi:ATP-independent RNA helicase DbpA
MGEPINIGSIHTFMTEFSQLGLNESLNTALSEVGYAQMTPVQAASLPPILAGRDVIAQAKTGSGKTAAFALGLLSALDASVVQLQGLVLCPTRELADQVSREIRRLARFIANVKVLTLCGGVPLRPHLASLAHEPHIVVGTPGRLLELLERNVLPLQSLKVLVLDEADRMLDMGFADAIRDIISHAPTKRQTLLFSATIPNEIRAISHEFQNAPADVTVVDEEENAIEQTFFEVEPDDKINALMALLSEYRPESAVVFCNTRDDVRRVAGELAAHEFSVLALHGELDQREREEMLVRFANRSANVLIASDVAARGLDIHDLPMVISFDVASDADTHLHRIGRTGRAGRSGKALALCSPREMKRAIQIEERQGASLHWGRLPAYSTNRKPLSPAFVTLAVDAGRTDKLRPGDLLGALTKDAGIPGDAVGKIDVFPTRTYVAIASALHETAMRRLRAGKIKGRTFRIRRLGP